MSLQYGDNFQSYAVGANPPYGGLIFYSGVVSPDIVADSAGLFGQTKSLRLPSTINICYPTPDYTGLVSPFYQQVTIYEYLKVSGGTDEQGVIISFGNCHTTIFGGLLNSNISGIRIMQDGTLAIVADFYSVFAPNSKVSDYSLLTGKWYLIRVDISFGSVLGNIAVLDCKVYVNGVVVAQVSGVTTSVTLASVDHLYSNIMNFGGADGSINIGGLWIYDTIPASNFYPNPTTPKARLNQGVIELIRKRITPVSVGGWQIYEA